MNPLNNLNICYVTNYCTNFSHPWLREEEREREREERGERRRERERRERERGGRGVRQKWTPRPLDWLLERKLNQPERILHCLHTAPHSEEKETENRERKCWIAGAREREERNMEKGVLRLSCSGVWPAGRLCWGTPDDEQVWAQGQKGAESRADWGPAWSHVQAINR